MSIAEIEQEIVNVLAAEGVTAYPYEMQDLDELPVATLWLERAEPAYLSDVDQFVGVGELSWTLRYYISLMEGEAEAQTDAKAAIETIYSAFGSDPTLGSRVVRIVCGTATQRPALYKGNPELVVEIELTAQLHANTGGA